MSRVGLRLGVAALVLLSVGACAVFLRNLLHERDTTAELRAQITELERKIAAVPKPQPRPVPVAQTTPAAPSPAPPPPRNSSREIRAMWYEYPGETDWNAVCDAFKIPEWRAARLDKHKLDVSRRLYDMHSWLELPANTRRRLIDLLAEHEVKAMETRAVQACEGKEREAVEYPNAELRALLGKDRLEKFREYRDNEIWRDLIRKLNGRLQLSERVTDAAVRPLIDALNNPDDLEAALSLLSEAQRKVFTRMLEDNSRRTEVESTLTQIAPEVTL